MELLYIGFGPIASYKYSTFIHNAIAQGRLSRYHVIDCESQRELVESRLAKLPTQPASRVYIPNHILENGPEAGIEWLVEQGIFAKSDVKKRVVITTEPQAHGAYLKHALAQQFDVLVSKPLILPMKDGVLDYRVLMAGVKEISDQSVDAKVNAAVLCFGRHHGIYDKKLRQPIEMMMDRLQTPITSAHLKTASGVWNFPAEYNSREDHPYKYGYGMLMHGAYHYIDILARLLLLNKKLYPDEEFFVSMQGYKAGPYDQDKRIGNLENKTKGYYPGMSELQDLPYGETDIVASYAMKFKSTGRVLTLGTISLEQTTPGMRSWGPFPDEYNINGRLHSTDFDVRLGTAFSVQANLTKRLMEPRISETDTRGINYASVITRANARIAGTQGYVRQENFERPWDNTYSYAAEADLFQSWLLDEPTYSDIASHLPACALLEGLLKISADDWSGNVEVDFNYPAPIHPPVENDDPWYTPQTDKVAFTSDEELVGTATRAGFRGTVTNHTWANDTESKPKLKTSSLTNGHQKNGVVQNGTPMNGILEYGPGNGTYMNGAHTNGFSTNGLSTNGLSTNGVSTNGVSTNGVSTNGVHTNGFSTNGTYTNGASANSVPVNGVSANGVAANGTYTNGTNVNGIHTNGTYTNGILTNGNHVNGTSTNGDLSNGKLENGLENSNLGNGHLEHSILSNGSLENGTLA